MCRNEECGEKKIVGRWGGRGFLPGLFGLEIDRLSLSANLSISPSLCFFLSPSLSPSLPPSCCGAERCRENEGQTEIWGDRMMECAPLMNRIREEEEGEEVGPEME